MYMVKYRLKWTHMNAVLDQYLGAVPLKKFRWKDNEVRPCLAYMIHGGIEEGAIII